MEKALTDRDRIGVPDFVLLEDYQSEEAFIDNLRKRFNGNVIYTYIGNVLISVNPYKDLPIYDKETIQRYRKAGFLEAAPHVFAIADLAYRSLNEERREQCILISGESGSGKTEASKKILHFIAAASGHKKQIEHVKDKLLQSNPVLEAFGNAKTNRNDNSSRFGKYMDIAFDFMGDPVGGNILNYLLEKSRVVHQNPGERNFHVFYQLLAGADSDTLEKLHLKPDYKHYNYLCHNGNDSDSPTLASQYKEVRHAMNVIELTREEQEAIYEIIASILHVGNVTFETEDDKSKIIDLEPIQVISKLLHCKEEKLIQALTHRTIEARGDRMTSPLNKELAIYARDALAKAVYDRLFSWLVRRLNNSLQPPDTNVKTTVMGILDIYGFEVFKKNSFEQFCINYCNEKLQQLFLELTLKSEQEEYEREGIEWERIEFFNNKIICDLIEEKHKGVIAILDEECLRPGDPNDSSFLEKMDKTLHTHDHYFSYRKSDLKTQKSMTRDEFRLIHYAGDVTYDVHNFLDKNNDLLFRDLREVMTDTKNSITQQLFTEEELNSKKRPDTAITQFKNSLNKLMIILANKEPSYIRCIKPNDDKHSGVFDDDIVKHQVKYLGLMENLRVRRAGFAYRRPFEDFLQRYKCLCPKTWPNYRGSAKEGVQVLVNHLQYDKEEYRMGKTKIFIRSPKTLFQTEDQFQIRKNWVASQIQKIWKGKLQRRKYLKLREAAIVMQKNARRYLAKQELKRKKHAVKVVRNFVLGFVTRNGPITDLNKKFVEIARKKWLIRLSKNLPRNVLDKSWPPCPVHCKEASELLHTLHTRNQVRKYVKSLSNEKKLKFEEKVMAESLFKGKKKSYQKSLPHWFESSRLSGDQTAQVNSYKAQHLNGEKVLYATGVTKYDRHGYKQRDRVLVMTNQKIYLLSGKKGNKVKRKHGLDVKSILELVVTSENDNLLLIRIPLELKKDKGDLILMVPHLIEAISLLVNHFKKPDILKIINTGTIEHKMLSGKQGTISVQKGTEADLANISKGKNKQLIVVG